MSDLTINKTQTADYAATKKQDDPESGAILPLNRCLPVINTLCGVFLVFCLVLHPPVPDYVVAYSLLLVLLVLGHFASDNWRTLLWGAGLALLSGMTDRSPIETAPLIFCIVLNLLFLED